MNLRRDPKPTASACRLATYDNCPRKMFSAIFQVLLVPWRANAS